MCPLPADEGLAIAAVIKQLLQEAYEIQVKCDVHENFPASCTRCSKSGRKCFIDPAYKRTARKDRLESMEREVRELRESLRTPQNHDSDLHTHGVASITPQLSRSSSGDGPDKTDAYGQVPGSTNHFRGGGAYFKTRTIDGVELSHLTIADLLETYHEECHNRFPLLSNPVDSLLNYDSCPFLFWTIMAIASRGSQQHSQLYAELQGPVTRLAGECASRTSRSVSFVQGLLLLCMWPFPFVGLGEEPSWLYCGLATHMAMLLGLHRPQHPSSFLASLDAETESVEVRRRTWLACFIVDQKTSARFGVPATIKCDNTIRDALSRASPTGAPDHMEHDLHIAYISSKYSNLLGQYENDSAGLMPDCSAIVRMLDTELGIVQTKYNPVWAPGTEIAFLGARLMLYSYILSQGHEQITKPRHNETDTEYVTMGAMAATRLLHVAYTKPDEVLKGTAHVRMCVVYAVLFLVRISRTHNEFSIDEAAVKNSISQTWTLLQQCAGKDQEFISKICHVIEYISKADWKKDPTTPPMRGRMGANFVLDVVLRAKERSRLSSPMLTEATPQDPMTLDGMSGANPQYQPWTEFPEDPSMLNLHADFGGLFNASL